MVPVVVNVYDMSEQNKWLYCLGIGIYHSAVEIHGVEYAFGAHDFQTSGIFATHPREAPGEVEWRTGIAVGETDLSPQEVQQLVRHLGHHYLGTSYHLLQMNCNHFTSDFCFELCHKRPPSWINRLAGMVVALHCLFPADWVPPLNPPRAVPSFRAPGSSREGTISTSAPALPAWNTRRESRKPLSSEERHLLGSRHSDAMDDSLEEASMGSPLSDDLVVHAGACARE